MTPKKLHFPKNKGCLEKSGMNRDDNDDVTHKYYVSDVPDKFTVIAERFLGRAIDNITRVDITRY